MNFDLKKKKKKTKEANLAQRLRKLMTQQEAAQLVADVEETVATDGHSIRA